MVDTLNHPDLPLSPTRWRCLPAPETLMRIRSAKLLPRDEVGWISRNRLDSGRCLSLFLDIPFYRTQNPCSGHFACNSDVTTTDSSERQLFVLVLDFREKRQHNAAHQSVSESRFSSPLSLPDRASVTHPRFDTSSISPRSQGPGGDREIYN